MNYIYFFQSLDHYLYQSYRQRSVDQYIYIHTNIYRLILEWLEQSRRQGRLHWGLEGASVPSALIHGGRRGKNCPSYLAVAPEEGYKGL